MEKGSWGTLETVIVIVVFAGAFGWTLGPVLWSDFRNARLLERGVPSTARIVEIVDTGDRLNTNPIVRVRLSVRDATGGEFPAEARMVASAVRLQTMTPGTEVAVRYDAGDHARVVIDDRAGGAARP